MKTNSLTVLFFLCAIFINVLLLPISASACYSNDIDTDDALDTSTDEYAFVEFNTFDENLFFNSTNLANSKTYFLDGFGCSDEPKGFEEILEEPFLLVSFIVFDFFKNLNIDRDFFDSAKIKYQYSVIAGLWVYHHEKCTPAPVPVPDSIWLFSSGLIGVALMRKREKEYGTNLRASQVIL